MRRATPDIAIISYEEYFPYGDTSLIAGTAQKEVKIKEYRYTGKEKDDATGLYYYGARYYASWLGRWMSADPLFRENPAVYERPKGSTAEEQQQLDAEYSQKLYSDGLNMYCYVKGNPVTFSDPSGREAYQMARKVDVKGFGGYAHTFIVVAYSDKELKESFTNKEAAKFGSIKLDKDIQLGDKTFNKGDTLRYRIMSANKSSGIFPEVLIKSTSNNAGAKETYKTDKAAFMEVIKGASGQISFDEISQKFIRTDPININGTRQKGKWNVSYIQLRSADGNNLNLDKNLINAYEAYNNEVTYNAASAGQYPSGRFFGNCNTFSTSIADMAGATNYFPKKWDKKEIKELNGLEMRGNIPIDDKQYFPGFTKER